MAYFPTVLIYRKRISFYQPVTAVRLEDISDFLELTNKKTYQSNSSSLCRISAHNKGDVNHNPSLKSCMVRVPGSVNSKNGKEVEVVQEWNKARPSIVPLLGIFYSWLATKKIVEYKRIKSYRKNSTGITRTDKMNLDFENKTP